MCCKYISPKFLWRTFSIYVPLNVFIRPRAVAKFVMPEFVGTRKRYTTGWAMLG
jgi:hypothetical protein